jgi:putative endonuclease
MDKSQNKETGSEGEEIAAEYLEKLGYKILDRNLELFCGEIDILAWDHRTIVICEVKTVKGTGFGPAKDLVRHRKQQKLRTLARTIEQQYPDRNIRVDVIGVEMYCNPPKIEHLKNVVTA